MTAGEFQTSDPLPSYPGWMSCHFSPYGTGLSNMPNRFPAHLMLMVDDLYPANDHDPVRITEELSAIADQVDCVLLDFQRPGIALTRKITEQIAQTLPCPVGISQHYALSGRPVLVPPIPEDMPFAKYFEKWQGQEIWLEVSTAPLCLEISENGCSEVEDFSFEGIEHFYKNHLCYYKILQKEDRFYFHFRRKPEDIPAFCEKVSNFGVTKAIGLRQEYK